MKRIVNPKIVLVEVLQYIGLSDVFLTAQLKTKSVSPVFQFERDCQFITAQFETTIIAKAQFQIYFYISGKLKNHLFEKVVQYMYRCHIFNWLLGAS